MVNHFLGESSNRIRAFTATDPSTVSEIPPKGTLKSGFVLDTVYERSHFRQKQTDHPTLLPPYKKRFHHKSYRHPKSAVHAGIYSLISSSSVPQASHSSASRWNDLTGITWRVWFSREVKHAGHLRAGCIYSETVMNGGGYHQGDALLFVSYQVWEQKWRLSHSCACLGWSSSAATAVHSLRLPPMGNGALIWVYRSFSRKSAPGPWTISCCLLTVWPLSLECCYQVLTERLGSRSSLLSATRKTVLLRLQTVRIFDRRESEINGNWLDLRRAVQDA